MATSAIFPKLAFLPSFQLWPPNLSRFLRSGIEDCRHNFNSLIFPQYVIENYSLSFLTFEEGELHLFNLDQDPYEEVDLAVEKEEKLNGMKELAREWAADLKVAFQPNRFPPEFTRSNFAFSRFSLGYPRYHKGLLEPGWCKPGWWNILWKPENFVTFLARI